MSLRAQVIAALKWAVAGRISSQLLSWAATIVVVRWVAPSEYGLIAMATILSTTLSIIAEIGIGASITQVTTITARQLRQILGVVILSNLAAFAILSLIVAPATAWFFHEPKARLLVIAIALQFIPAAFIVVPSALLDRELAYRARAAVDVAATIIGGASTLLMAWNDFGAWAIAWGQLIVVSVRAIGLTMVAPSRVWPLFDFSGVSQFLRFGRDVAANSLVFNLYSQADAFVVGRLLGKTDLGIYSVSLNLASTPASRLAATINQVAFPTLSKARRESGDISMHVSKALRLISLVAFPIMWGMSSVAPEIVQALLGDRWQQATTTLVLLCLIMPLRSIGPVFTAGLQAVGRADISFYNTCTAAVIMCIAFVVGAQFGLLGVSLSWIIAFPFVFLINTARSVAHMGLTVLLVMRALYRSIIPSAIMYGAVAATRPLLTLAPIKSLLALIAAGAIAFCAACFLLNRESVIEALSLLRSDQE